MLKKGINKSKEIDINGLINKIVKSKTFFKKQEMNEFDESSESKEMLNILDQLELEILDFQ